MTLPLILQNFIELFIIYSISYLIIQYNIPKNHKLSNVDCWSIFVKSVSTANAVSCILHTLKYVYPNYVRYYDLFEHGDDAFVRDLYRFAGYLFVDGIFLIIITKKYNTTIITSLLHHFVGGLGIYLIASQRQGLGLGAYFAWTELSTPLLNLSWILYTSADRGNNNDIFDRTVFIVFYIIFFLCRIATIPLLLDYIDHNIKHINGLPLFHYLMVYGGSYTLIALNVVWFIMLSIKLFHLIRSDRTVMSIEMKKRIEL